MCNDRHFCTEIGAAPTIPGLRAVLRKDLRWVRGDTISVAFRGGSAALRERIVTVAHEWFGSGMAGLELRVVDHEPADVRIAFRAGAGSWSAIGTSCRDVPAGDPTMNFGWLTDDSPDEVLRPVVLHEFGHVVGLVHEHQSAQHPIAWNRAAVIADVSGPPNRWDVATIERNIFATHEPLDVVATELDPQSIMMYPIPRAWTCDGFSTGFTIELSDQDRELVRTVYGA